MARRSKPEIAVGVLLIVGAGVGGVFGLLHSGGSTDHLSAIVRSLAGATIGGAVTVVFLGVAMFAFEGFKTLSGNPSDEPTLADIAPEATSVADARMYSMAAVACLVIGVFVALVVMWFFALVFALLARKASGDDKRWRRATTVLWAATALGLAGMFLLGSGLVGN